MNDMQEVAEWLLVVGYPEDVVFATKPPYELTYQIACAIARRDNITISEALFYVDELLP